MERLGSIGLNSALIQDPAPQAEAGNGGIHRKPVDFGKPGVAGGGAPIWARGAGDRDPLFPEPSIGPAKAFNGGAARWGGNEPKKWAGVRPGDGERRNAAPAVGLQGAARRWDDARPQGRPNWVNDANEADNWRGARPAPRNNEIPWRKDGRREGSGALPGTFGAVLPGARAGAGMRPPQLNRAAGGAGPKYNKADLMDVFFKMKNEAGDEIPPPEDIADTEDFREIWRPLVEQQHTTNAEVHIAAPPGLDQVDTLKSEWIQVATKFAHLDIHCPLQALLMDQYFYKDPKGVIQGPFPSINLKGWDEQGYLYDNLQCRSALSPPDTYFPFSSLKLLWEIHDDLALEPVDLIRMADAEAKYGNLNHAEDIPNGSDIITHSQAGHHQMGYLSDMHPVDHVEQQMQAVALGGDHNMQKWENQSAEPAVALHAADPVHEVPYGGMSALQPEKVSPTYDPIDDIIDEPNAHRPAIDPRDGGRVLQPFGGMGSSVTSMEATAKPQALPEKASPPPEPKPQQQPVRMLAADPILNIPVHVERAAAAPAPPRAPPANSQAPKGAMVAQFISPSDLFGAKQPVGQVAQQPPPPPGPSPQQQAEGLAAYGAPNRGMPVSAAAATPAARGWAQHTTPQQAGVPLADIQREELVKRQQEEAAAQAAAHANALQEQQERERRAAWTAQPQPVPLRQIIEDEECAAELEGGFTLGKDDYSPGYNPWQGQAALPQDTDTAHAPYWEAPDPPAARAPAAPVARTAAQVVGKEQPRRAVAGAVAAGAGRPQAWQAAPNAGVAGAQKPKAVAGAPAPQQQSVIAGELEPEIFRNSPDFKVWCMKEMERLKGDENLLVVLLETGANFEIMEIARSNLKGDNIGAFVAEFIKRKANAQSAKGSGRRKRRAGAGAAAAAPPAPAATPTPAAPNAVASAGDGFVAVAAKGKGGKRRGPAQAANAQAGPRPGGNAFAMLPSM